MPDVGSYDKQRHTTKPTCEQGELVYDNENIPDGLLSHSEGGDEEGYAFELQKVIKKRMEGATKLLIITREVVER